MNPGERNDTVENYFRLALDYTETLLYLVLLHGIPLSLRQLKRVLKPKDSEEKETLAIWESCVLSLRAKKKSPKKSTKKRQKSRQKSHQKSQQKPRQKSRQKIHQKSWHKVAKKTTQKSTKKSRHKKKLDIKLDKNVTLVPEAFF